MLNSDDEKKIRLYLLGRLSEGEAEDLEQRYLVEDDLFERLEIGENELIEDYIEGQLSKAHRESFERNFLVSPQRIQKYKFQLALRKYVATALKASKSVADRGATKWWHGFSFASPAAWAIAALVVVGFSLVVWRVFIYESPLEKGLLALNAAYREQRPVESRLTGLAYSPFSTTRGPGDNVDRNELQRAELRLLDALSEDPTAENRHAVGKLYLAKREFERAIDEFQQALKADPENPKIHADLGAAYLEQGKVELEKGKTEPTGSESGKGLEDLGRSLEHLNLALKYDPDLLEARFNRALAHEYMSMTRQAADDWREYLKRDSKTRWAEEAQHRLQLLGSGKRTKSPEQALADFVDAYQRQDDQAAWRILSQTREMITGMMIPLQLSRMITGASPTQSMADVKAVHSVMRYAGELESQRAGDPFFRELAHYYGLASTTQQQPLQNGQNRTAAGYEACLASRFDDAIVQFEQARTEFERARNVWEARLTDYWIGYAYSRIGRISESTELLQKLAGYATSKGYKWLLMQALSWTANNFSLQRDYSRSLEYDNRALLLANAVADTYMQQKILAQIAQEYGTVASPGRALGYIQRALSLTDIYYESVRQQWRNYNFAAETLYDLKLFSAAADWGREALLLATQELNDPSTRHSSLVRLGRLYSASNQFTEAIRLTEESLQVANSLPPGRTTQSMSAFSNLNLANILKSSGDCRTAVTHYEDAIRFYEPMATTGFSVNHYNARKGRLQCYVKLGDGPATEKELPEVLALFEQHRSLILEELNRNTFFEKEQSVYDTAIEYAFAKHDREAAFNYAEIRARSLLDTLQSKAKVTEANGHLETVFSDVVDPLQLNEIRTRIPAEVQLLQYSILPEKILIWVISTSKFEVVERQISAAKVNDLISEFTEGLTRDRERKSDETRELGRELYDLLVTPVESLLDPRQVVCVIPDKTLTHLPFAALVSPSGPGYFVEKYSLMYAPSSSVFVLSTEAARQRDVSGLETLTTLGNPAFSRTAYPELKDLPGADREAKTIARLYDNGKSVVGRQADKLAFTREIADSDVIHFAGHYLPNEVAPLQSKLVLAESNGSNSDFAVKDIFASNFARPRLIVLSACRTELDRHYDGEGAIGIARSFLGAGIPVVVASQWPVDSEATAELMIAFHRYRSKEKLPTSAALRRAQLNMIQSAESRSFREPYYWAGFATLGGYATF